MDWQLLKLKIREFINTALILAVAIGAAVIYALTKKLDKARYEKGQLEADKSLAEAVTKKDEAVKDADSKESDYDHIRDAFEHNNDGGGNSH
jgi:hypothetical protein